MIKFVKIKKPEKKTLCLYFLFLVIMITVVASKKNLCGDEVFSYTLANGAGYVRFEEGVTYQSPQKLFANEITVNNTGGGAI